MSTTQSSFLNALEQKNQSNIPVWFMRQAGRYLPEYLSIKAEYDFKTRTHTPDLMSEITLQPLSRYPLDAAIMFSDILTCLEFMGAEFDFTSGGPKLAKPGIDTLLQLKSLNTDDMSFVYEGIQKIKLNLNNTPLIGFVGAPFTLISYIIEGGTSKDFINTRKYMLEQSENFSQSMSLITDSVCRYLKEQKNSGVNAVQVFDSWVGVLSLDEYEIFILPHMQRLINELKNSAIKVILYSQPTYHLLPALCKLQPNALSVDWRRDLKSYYQEINKYSSQDISIQGNLSPIVTTLEWEKAKNYVDQILLDVKELNIRDRFIFNVGHGVSPQTKPETIGKIVEYVHQN